MSDTCPRCKGTMKPGIATGQTYTGSPDMGDCITVNYGGPGYLVECLKCGSCGFSVTVGEARVPAKPGVQDTYRCGDEVFVRNREGDAPEGMTSYRSDTRGIRVFDSVLLKEGLVPLLDTGRYQTWYGLETQPEEVVVMVRVFVGNLVHSGHFFPDTFRRADEKNWTIYHEGTCATHDYCDANVYMDRAFRAVTGRMLNPRRHADANLWSQAFNHARTTGYERLSNLFYEGE